MVQITKEEFEHELRLFPAYAYRRYDDGAYAVKHCWLKASGRLIATRHEDLLTGEEYYTRPPELWEGERALIDPP